MTLASHSSGAKPRLADVGDPVGASATTTSISSNKKPNGYCGLGGTGVACPVGVASADS